MSNTNPSLNATLLQIPLDIIQQALDDANARGSGVAAFIMQDGACMGAATTTPPIDTTGGFYIVQQYATDIAINGDVTQENIYNIIALHSPISSTAISDMLGINRQERAKVWAKLSLLLRRKVIAKIPRTHTYQVIASVDYYPPNLEIVQPKKVDYYPPNLEIVQPKKARKQNRMRTTPENVMQVLRNGGPMTTMQICDAMRIMRTEGCVRTRVTKILRNNLGPAGKVLIEEKAGGKSIYTLSPKLVLR